MQPTTVYSLCPGCKADALVQPVQASQRCAACNYDYAALARDEPARERWMLQNLQADPTAKLLSVMFLHRSIMEQSPADSNARVIAFAQRHGIRVPGDKSGSSWLVVGSLVGVAVLAVLAYLLLAG